MNRANVNDNPTGHSVFSSLAVNHPFMYSNVIQTMYIIIVSKTSFYSDINTFIFYQAFAALALKMDSVDLQRLILNFYNQ